MIGFLFNLGSVVALNVCIFFDAPNFFRLKKLRWNSPTIKLTSVNIFDRLTFDFHLYTVLECYLKNNQNVFPVFEKNSFISPNQMPSVSMDSLSEIYASSALINCKPVFLVPVLLKAQVGFGTTHPPWCSTTWWRNRVRHMRRLFRAFIDYSFAFESVNRNPLLNKARWIKFRPCIIDFQAELVP